MTSEIRVNKITHTAGVGTVTTNTHGIVVSGIVTATTFKGNVEATTGSFSGNLGVGGVLTYEDVTNIDSVGIITARTDVLVGNNIKLGASSGIVTATSFSGSGANLTALNVVTDTSPQLGGDLDTNSFEISLDDDHKVKFGASDDLYIWHNSSTGNSNISNVTGNLYIQGNNGSGTAVNLSLIHI